MKIEEKSMEYKLMQTRLDKHLCLMFIVLGKKGLKDSFVCAQIFRVQILRKKYTGIYTN